MSAPGAVSAAGPVTAASLMDGAAARAGTDDWGDLGFTRTLDLLVEACRETARLTPAGWDVLARTLRRHLVNRLAVQAWVCSHPAPAPPAPAPVVVTGLPRTGTTLVHNLLASDTRYRFLRLWEALRPAAAAAAATSGPTWRREHQQVLVGQAEAWLERFRALVPGFEAIRPATAEGPEECDTLLQNSFASLHFDDMWDADAYSRWFARADLAPEYRYYALQLALVSSGDHGPPRPWALKSPGHLGHLDALLDALPGAVVLYCHRHPVEAVASWGSLIRAVRSPHTQGVDPVAVGRQALRRAWLATERALAVRDRVETGEQAGEQAGVEPAPTEPARFEPAPTEPAPTEPARFLDVAYPRLVRQPLEVLSEVHAGLGRPLGPDVLAAMRRWLVGNPQHGHGPHHYGLEDLGLRAGQVTERFIPYLERFGDLVEA